MPRLINLIERKFGRWTVVGPYENRKWGCVCQCGRTGEIFSTNLTSGISKSCGCLNSEMIAKRNFKHGLSYHPLRMVWSNMMRRCYNKTKREYKWYGAIGISVVKRWHKFVNFYNDTISSYSPGLSLDRIDVKGNYSKGNCRWATPTEQARNRTNNRIITIDGVSKCVAEFAELVGIHPNLIHTRLGRGWSGRESVFGKNKNK